MNSANPPNSQPSSQPGEAIADLINDMRRLASTLDFFALSFTLAWTQNPDYQRQHFPISQPERTTP
jgi:hypothetical protein